MQLDKDFAKFLDQYIEEKVQQIVSQRLNEYGNMRGWSAIVTGVNGDGTVNVTLAGDTVTIPNLKNKSNVTLSTNDEVFLFSISSLNNAFVGVKK